MSNSNPLTAVYGLRRAVSIVGLGFCQNSGTVLPGASYNSGGGASGGLVPARGRGKEARARTATGLHRGAADWLSPQGRGLLSLYHGAGRIS